MSAANPAEGTFFIGTDSDGEPTLWVETDSPARPVALLRKGDIWEGSNALTTGDTRDRVWAGIVEWVEPKTTLLELKKPSAEERERALDLAEAMVDRMIDKPTDGQPAYVRLEDRLKLVLDAAAFLLGETR